MTSNKILEWEIRADIADIYNRFGWIVAEDYNNKLNEVLRNNPLDTNQEAFVALDKEIKNLMDHNCEEHEAIMHDGIVEEHSCSICGKILKIVEAYEIFN